MEIYNQTMYKRRRNYWVCVQGVNCTQVSQLSKIEIYVTNTNLVSRSYKCRTGRINPNIKIFIQEQKKNFQNYFIPNDTRVNF